MIITGNLNQNIQKDGGGCQVVHTYKLHIYISKFQRCVVGADLRINYYEINSILPIFYQCNVTFCVGTVRVGWNGDFQQLNVLPSFYVKEK